MLQPHGRLGRGGGLGDGDPAGVGERGMPERAEAGRRALSEGSEVSSSKLTRTLGAASGAAAGCTIRQRPGCVCRA